MASRDFKDLQPEVAKLARVFVSECASHGYEILITCTYRSQKEQSQLYKQGRTKPGKIVTNAKAGQSYHNYRCAFDFVPMRNGKCCWNDTTAFYACGKIAEGIGLEWAGRWTRFKELGHCQYTGGLTIADLQKKWLDHAN